jgi:hypothetical protein
MLISSSDTTPIPTLLRRRPVREAHRAEGPRAQVRPGEMRCGQGKGAEVEGEGVRWVQGEGAEVEGECEGV